MDLVLPLTISVTTSRQSMNVEELCGSAVRCAPAQTVSEVWILAVTGLVTFALLAAAFYVRDARAAVDEERSRTHDEQTAFAEFGRRVGQLEASSALAATAAEAPVMSVSRPPPSRQLQQVADAYRSTVMAVPHFEEEYGESLAEHMAAEFGDPLASAVTAGAEFTPPLQAALVRQSADAERSRARFIDRIDREDAALADAASELEQVADGLDEVTSRPIVAHRFDELLDEWERLKALDHRCNQLLDDRQRQMNHEPTDGGRLPDAFDLHDYLYWSLPVDHPILADAADLLERLGDARREVTLAITARA